MSLRTISLVVALIAPGVVASLVVAGDGAVGGPRANVYFTKRSRSPTAVATSALTGVFRRIEAAHAGMMPEGPVRPRLLSRRPFGALPRDNKVGQRGQVKTGPFRGRVFSEGLMVVGRVYRNRALYPLRRNRGASS